MTSRPSRVEVMLAVAATISLRGTCDRKQVGAVIERRGRPISWGYNGAPPGLPHCDANNHGWSGHESETLMYPNTVEHAGCRNATHAEANALAFAAKQGISTDGASLFVTLSPCEVCARLIIAAGIVAVYYLEEYRDPAGIELLERGGVLCASADLQGDSRHRSDG